MEARAVRVGSSSQVCVASPPPHPLSSFLTNNDPQPASPLYTFSHDHNISMTGVQGQILGHVVRRTVQMSTAVMPGRNRAADAQVYDVGNSAPGDTERIHEFIRSTLARLSCTEKLTIYVLLGLAAFHMLLLVSVRLSACFPSNVATNTSLSPNTPLAKSFRPSP